MKLVRYGAMGRERPGLIDQSGTLRDLSRLVPDIAGDVLNRDVLARLASLEPQALPEVAGSPRLGAPVGGVRNFIGVGLNYADHAVEAGKPIPKEPILFNKAVSSICGPNDDVIVPPGAVKLDWEVELAVVIGEPAWQVSEARALNHVAGYCVCNDLSERAWQMDGSGQWMKAKSAPTFGPLGPWLVTADEVPDSQNLTLFLKLNGLGMQSGSTRTMVFSVAELIAYISRFIRLETGDVITTGTPPGTGMSKRPPQFLKPGDVMRLGVEGLGEQRHTLVMEGAVSPPLSRVALAKTR